MARDLAAELEFRDFVATRSVALQQTAYLLVGDWALAEDLVPAALMKTYLAWHRLEVAAVEPYARKVLLNTAISWWRGERPTAELPERPVPDGADERMEWDRVWQLIKALPPRQRAVLVLRFYEDLTEVETARPLGVAVGTVKSQSARALSSLRQRLDRRQTTDQVTNGSKA